MPGSIEHWATERYCLYAERNGRLQRVEDHLSPWPLQPAEVGFRSNGMLEATGIEPLNSDPICHFSTGGHAVSFLPERTERR